MSGRKPVVLYATPVLHHPPNGGPALRVENSIKALTQVADLYVYARTHRDAIGGTEAIRFYRRYCHEFFLLPVGISRPAYRRLILRAVNYIARRIGGRNLVKDTSAPQPEDMGKVLKLADQIRADLIWLGYGNISYPLLKYIKQKSALRVVVDTDSVWSRYVLRGTPYLSDATERAKAERLGREKEAEESWGTRMADVTTAVSDVDAAYYRLLAQSPDQVHQFSNVLDIAQYKAQQPPPLGFKRPCLLLAGTFWPGSPMEDAARWLIREVLPTLHHEAPELHTYILGQGSNQTLADVCDPAITIAGPVASVLPYLQHCTMAVVPLRFESGTRFKILEAGACSLPVVSTTLGAEGLGATDQQELLIADTPAQFAEAILAMLRDGSLAAKLGTNLHALVKVKYDLDTLVREAEAILTFLSRSTNETGPA